MTGVTLLEPVGSGATATVFRARTADGRLVAAKRVPSTAADALRAEAAALQAAAHPHVIECLGLVERDDEALLLLPLADGSLADRLATRGPLPPTEVGRLGTALAAALAHAHDRGVLHRDVKPRNVLWVEGRVVLADFGARVSADASAGEVTGSACWLDPRLVDGAAPDPAADVYALGATLHEALTGQPPFVAATPLATIEAARTTPYPRPGDPAAAALADVLASMLGDVAGRPSAAAAAAELARLTPGPERATTPQQDVAWARPRPLRRRHDALTDTRTFSPTAPGRPVRVPPALRAAVALTGIAAVVATTAGAAASLHLF